MLKIKTENLIKVGVITALLGIIYYPSFEWLWGRWNAAETYYSHGPLIPLASLFFLWSKREKFKTLALKTSGWGIALILFGLLMHIIGLWSGIYFVSPISLIVVISGLILYFFGIAVFKEVIFPVLFLFFMVPLPLVLIADINFKLKIIATDWSVFTLNKIGIQAVQDGSTIRMRNSYLLVAGQCSGLKYLISLVAFSAAFAYTINKKTVFKWIIFLISPFIALMSNAFRIVLLGWVSDVYGMEAALGWFHDFSGFLLFFVATIGLLVITSLFPSNTSEIDQS